MLAGELLIYCRGGLELLMGHVKEHKVKIDEGPSHVGQAGVTIKQVISWIKVHYY